MKKGFYSSLCTKLTSVALNVDLSNNLGSCYPFDLQFLITQHILCYQNIIILIYNNI